jgi:hypothetical protein
MESFGEGSDAGTYTLSKTINLTGLNQLTNEKQSISTSLFFSETG